MAAPKISGHIQMYWFVLCGLCLRVLLTLYGEWQDRTMAVKFTDIDYHVFNDAALFVSQGKSPYLRATYRYTPLLAYMLQPNIHCSIVFGKLVFILFDIYTGYLIYAITKYRGISEKLAVVCAATWLLNPLPMAVSSRGNAESLMSCLVLLCLKFIMEQKTVHAAIVFAVSVHFKVYPVIYALPIYLELSRQGCEVERASWMSRFKFLLPTKDRCLFIITAALVFLGLTALFYHLYGWEFLQHTYLYHVTRKDIRHNFSVYFYLLYQQSTYGQSVLMALLGFVPQMLLLLVFSFKFYGDLALVFFLNTFAFVTFNKVCTSQYFLWYLCLLPILLPQMRMSRLKAACIIALWFIGQGIWLAPAYYLEFEGLNTFPYIWLAGIAFFLINCYIMYAVMDTYDFTESISQSERSAMKQSGNASKRRSDYASKKTRGALDEQGTSFRNGSGDLNKTVEFTQITPRYSNKVTRSSSYSPVKKYRESPIKADLNKSIETVKSTHRKESSHQTVSEYDQTSVKVLNTKMEIQAKKSTGNRRSTVKSKSYDDAVERADKPANRKKNSTKIESKIEPPRRMVTRSQKLKSS